MIDDRGLECKSRFGMQRMKSAALLATNYQRLYISATAMRAQQRWCQGQEKNLSNLGACVTCRHHSVLPISVALSDRDR